MAVAENEDVDLSTVTYNSLLDWFSRVLLLLRFGDKNNAFKQMEMHRRCSCCTCDRDSRYDLCLVQYYEKIPKFVLQDRVTERILNSDPLCWKMRQKNMEN